MSSSVRLRITRLSEQGLTAPQIARELGVAAPTVRYHLARIASPPPPTGETSPGAPPPVAQEQVPTRRAVADLLGAGVSRAQIAHQLGLAKATVSYHARRLNRQIDERCARRYDWSLVQRYYDEGHSVRECMATFGFSSASWYDAVRRGSVSARPAGMPIEELLKAGTYRGRYHLKARLIAEGLKKSRCEECGLSKWQGRAITLALHHVNGIRNDNRLENLQLLCPNCHSQTDTYAGRNGRERRAESRAGPADRGTTGGEGTTDA